MRLNSLLSFFTVVFLGTSGLLQAKHPGGYLKNITLDYVTPHHSFGNGKQPLKALFIMARKGARDAVEIQQRFPMQAEYFLTYDHRNLVCEDMYESAVEGTSRFEKVQELNGLLQKRYDVCIVGKFQFAGLPDEAQFRILTAVQNGMGLILSNPFNAELPRYKKLYQKPLPIPEELQAFAQPSPHLKLQAWQLGKGRILAVSWKRSPWISPQDRSLLPLLDYSNQWVTANENSAAFMGMLCRFAAGHSIELTNPRIRIRDRWNRIVKNNALPAGLYFKDILGENGACLISRFTVPSVLGAITLELPESVCNHQPIHGSFSLEKPLSQPCIALIELLDSPYGRIWHRQRLSLTGGQRKCSFVLDDYPMPTLAGYIRVTVKDSRGKALLIDDKAIFFPDASVPDYAQLGWDTLRGTTGALLEPQLIGRLNWRLGLTHPSQDGENIRQMAMLNQKCVAYTTRIMLEKSPSGGVRQGNWFFVPRELKADLAKLQGDECFYRPEVQRLWRLSVLNRVKNLKHYSTAIYSLGDENFRNPDAGYGPSDTRYFREFLQKKYRTIENLNYNYRSAYQSFSEVPHLPQNQARQQKNYAAWADHRAYMDRMYADLHAYLRKVIREYDPEAKVGAEGSVPGNLEETIAELEYWGPYHDRIEDELLRSFAPEKYRMLWWGGYPGSHGGRGRYPTSLLRDMLLGTINGNAWFSSEPGSNHSCFGCDFTIADYVKNYLPDLDRMTRGTAHLLIRNPLLPSGMAIYWSHASDIALLATGSGIGPRDGIPALLDCAYQYGLGFDFISARTLDRLKSARILFLCGASALSDEECLALRTFVRRGGTIVADAVPAVMNEHLRIREQNPLADLFGNTTFSQWCSETGFKAVQLSEKHRCQKVRLFQKETLIRKKSGAGQILLTNFSFSSAANSSEMKGSFQSWLYQLMQEAGISGEVTVKSTSSRDTVLRIRRNRDFILIGALDPSEKLQAELELNFSGDRHIYEVDAGYAGRSSRLPISFSSSPLKVYALFDSLQKAPEFSVATVRRGRFLRLVLPELHRGRSLRLELRDPSGKERFLAVFDCEQNRPCPAVAYNDPAGQWTAVLTDVATGLRQTIPFEVK